MLHKFTLGSKPKKDTVGQLVSRLNTKQQISQHCNNTLFTANRKYGCLRSHHLMHWQPENRLSGLRIPMCNFLRVLGLLFYEGCHLRFRDHKRDNPLSRHGWSKRFELGNFELETFPDVCIRFNGDGMAMDISDLKIN